MTLLAWHPPYDWEWMFSFLGDRAVQGVETFVDGRYIRSFALAGHAGLITVTPDEAAQGMQVTLSPGLEPVADECLARIGRLFDLSCDPQQVALTLGELAQPRPGLRLPGKPGLSDGRDKLESGGYPKLQQPFLFGSIREYR